MSAKKAPIELQCQHCQKTFYLKPSVYKYRLSRKRNGFYCTRKCADPHRVTTSVDKDIDNRPFRYIWQRAKNGARIKKGEFNLTVEDIKDLWEKQGGICPYTGLKMLPPVTHRQAARGEKEFHPTTASLDRIDSNLGYVKGNVEFVCLSVNYAKNGFTREQMKDFFTNSQKAVMLRHGD